MCLSKAMCYFCLVMMISAVSLFADHPFIYAILPKELMVQRNEESDILKEIASMQQKQEELYDMMKEIISIQTQQKMLIDAMEEAIQQKNAAAQEMTNQAYLQPQQNTHQIEAEEEPSVQWDQQELMSMPQAIADPDEITNNNELCCDDNECTTCCNLCVTVRSECDPWAFPLRFYVNHVEERWLNNVGYTSVGLFAALPGLMIDRILPIIDASKDFFNDGQKAENIGLGLRYVLKHCVMGINLFYDSRKSDVAHYHQGGIGIEFLSECWDVRLNGYFPFNPKIGHSRVHRFTHFSNPELFATCQERQGALTGGDIELGRWIKQMGPCDCIDLYLSFGGHYYYSKKEKTRYGATINLISHIGRYLSVEVRGGYDRISKGMIGGGIFLTIPFGAFPRLNLEGGCLDPCTDKCCVNWIALQPIRRQKIITLGKKNCCWTWNWDSCSQ